MKERMQAILDHTGLNYTQFEREIGLGTSAGSGAISKIIAGSDGISAKTTKKIFERFPEYNLDWLLTGRGDMLFTVQSKVKNLTRPLNQNSIVTVDTSDNVIVPIVDPKAAAGAAFIYDKPDYLQEYPTFGFPNNFLRSGAYASFPVKGDSMYPTIKQGDYVVAREIEGISYIRNGEVYVVVYQADQLLHFFVKRGYYFFGENILLLRSDNDDFPDEEITIDSITKLYHVEACVTTQFVRVESYRGRFDRIEQRIDRIEKAVVRV